MEVIHPRCAGIDVSKKDAKVCVRVQGRGRKATSSEVTTWTSMTSSILALREYLIAERVTCVVIESTAAYWKPFYFLLDDALNVMLVNARHVTQRARTQDRLVDRTTAGDFGAGACREGFGWLGSLLVMGDGEQPRDLAVLVVPGRGGLEATGDLFQPYRLVDADGGVVAPVAAYFAELTRVRATGDDSAFVWDGSVAVVSVPVGVGGGLGSGDSGGSPRFLSLAADRGQAGPATLAASGRRCCRRGAVTDRAGRECGDRQGGSR